MLLNGRIMWVTWPYWTGHFERAILGATVTLRATLPELFGCACNRVCLPKAAPEPHQPHPRSLVKQGSSESLKQQGLERLLPSKTRLDRLEQKCCRGREQRQKELTLPATRLRG